MSEPHNGDKRGRNSEETVALLTKLTQLEEKHVVAIQEQNDLAKQRTETTSNLALYSFKMAENAEKQTGLAQERTALTREQTRLSTRSTELANIRSELAQERTLQAEERSRLATQRTEMARQRTSLSESRTKLAERRNDLARERTVIATTRTRLSLQRTELARERTSLALIRTGLAFMTLGVGFIRYFGVSVWSLFDFALLLFSVLVVYFGAKGYLHTRAREKRLVESLTHDPGIPGLLWPGTPARPAQEGTQL